MRWRTSGFRLRWRIDYARGMSLEIVIVRHALAFERDSARWPDDRARPLTPEGKRKFRGVAAGLMKWQPRVEAMLTSPLIRARQTADLLTDVARWPKAVEAEELAADSAPEAVLPTLRRQRVKRLALVGHEPHLSELLAICVVGTAG